MPGDRLRRLSDDEVTEIATSGFGRRCAAAFRERLRRSDIILATHNSQTIRQYCDRGAILAGGRLELFDDIASAFERYRRMLAGGGGVRLGGLTRALSIARRLRRRPNTPLRQRCAGRARTR